jgi:hypothetical protein
MSSRSSWTTGSSSANTASSWTSPRSLSTNDVYVSPTSAC